MNDRQGLLNAIIARPEDDLPRLVFADWLEDHDECARAEFIRVQIELAIDREKYERLSSSSRTLAGSDSDFFVRYRLLDTRQRILLAQNRVSFDGAIKHLAAIGTFEQTTSVTGDVFCYRRGFMDSICCSWEDWIQHGRLICKESPLREVYLTTLPNLAGSRASQAALEAVWPNIRFLAA